MTKILFSPIGDTDPVRGCRDGAMLHIVRHYAPEKVVLFFTKEMEDRDRENDRYVRAIHKLAPKCEVEKIYSGITNAHLYDEFLTVLPQTLYEIRERYPMDEILLNLSSGTPQIKTLMAFFAVDLDRTKGIQVVTPEGGSNRTIHPEKDSEDVEMLLAMNEDNEAGQKNRCEEPKLDVIKRYGLRRQIISLIKNYEYRGAFEIYKNNRHLFSASTGLLLEHAIYRESLMTKEAKNVLQDYKGRSLFKIAESEPRKLVEFFLVMQIRQYKGELPELLLKVTPFMYEITKFYVREIKAFNLDACCIINDIGMFDISEEKVREYDPALLDFLKRKNFRYGSLSLFSLLCICQYLSGTIMVGNESHKKIIEELERHKKGATGARNCVAHEISNLSEKTFKQEVGLSSADLIKHLRKVLELVLKGKVKGFSNVYDEINNMLVESLSVTEKC